MYSGTTKVEDIFRLALPANTKLLAGEEYLNRSVSWACSLRPSPPAFPKLDGNELALIDMEDLHRLDPKMRLDRVVHSLRDARIAAIAVKGNVSRNAVAAAEASHVALFELTSDVPLVQVERTIIRLIVDRAGYIAQRSGDLQRELNQVALDGGSLADIAMHIHQFAQQPVILLREDGQLASTSGLTEVSEDRQQRILTALPNVTALRSWAASHQGASVDGAIGTLPFTKAISDTGYNQIVLSPVVASDAVRGYCIVLRPNNYMDHELTAVEEIAVRQGASAAALEWAKQNAIDVAQEQMRATFLDELLASEIADEEAWIERASSLNYDLTRPHAAWMIEAENVQDRPNTLLRFLNDQNIQAPFSRRGEGMLLFWPLDDPKSGRELKGVAFSLAERILVQNARASVVIGIGRPGIGPVEWMKSQSQARESWRMGKEWQASPVTYFGDLGLYQLLTALGDNPEARRFYRKTLGRLISHDESHNGELVGTLEGFFLCHGNLSQTANRLHIHRNTLTYRLDRIATITQLNLGDPDARFSLQLALKLRPVMK